MSDPKRPMGVTGITREEVQALIAENDDLKMQLRIAERQPPSPNRVPPQAAAKPAPRAVAPTPSADVTWRGVALWSSDTPTLAGIFLAMVGVVVAMWAIGFVTAGFNGTTARGAVMVALAVVAWWAVFARQRR